MKLLLVEAHDRIDKDVLHCLSAWLPHLKIEISDGSSDEMDVPSPTEILFICVSMDLETSSHVDVARRMQALFPYATLMLIRRTADLLALCMMLQGDVARPDGALPRHTGASPTGWGRKAEPPQPQLSKREMEILRLLHEGLQNKLIARRLDLSVSTVKTHVANIFRKIGATNRLEAIYKFTDCDRAAPVSPRQGETGLASAAARVQPFPRPVRPAMPSAAWADWAA